MKEAGKNENECNEPLVGGGGAAEVQLLMNNKF
jgi:hypothetical protein